MSPLDWIISLAYLAVVCTLALVSHPRGGRDNEDYFLGGRRLNWMAVGVSMFATSFSSISFLGLPQRGAYQDFSFFLILLLIPLLVTPLLWFVFIPLYVRLQVASGYAYLRQRFDPSVQRVGSLLYCLYAVGWMGTMLFAIALTLQSVLVLTNAQYVLVLVGVGMFATAYTALGGLRAVVWTDLLQAVTLAAAVLIVLALAVSGITDGWKGLWRIGQEHGRWKMIHWQAPPLSAENFRDANSVYTALAFALFMYLPGYAVAQNMIQRYVCTEGIRQARGVAVLSALINVGLGFLFLLVGVALFAFYMQTDGSGLPEIGSEDQILPYFVSTQAPGTGLVGLMLAGLFAAVMSTVDSGINGVAAVIVYDWMGGRELSVPARRILTVFLGALVVGGALMAPLLGQNLIDVINTVAGTLLGGLMAVFLLGLFVRHANGPGVLIGLGSGALTLAAVIVLTDTPRWWYGAFTIFPTLLVGAAASRWVTPRKPAAPSAALCPNEKKEKK